MPITTDSHFGEYLSWAHDVADHKGILDFYSNYKQECLEIFVSEDRITQGTDPEEYWRVIPIMEGIVSNSQHRELAVNIPNEDLIENLPRDMIVEVPATVDISGIHGVRLGKLPLGFAGLLQNQVAVNYLTAEAALSGSYEYVRFCHQGRKPIS